MKKVLLSLSVIFLLFSCSGKDGEVGPKGDTGATGPKGETGAAGSNGSQAYIYDFTLDVTKTTNSYKLKIPLDPQEMVFVFVEVMENFTSVLPFEGYAFDTNKRFSRLDLTYEYASNLLFIDNDTDLPAGSTFKFRAVIIKGMPGNRINMERYQDYANLKSDFNLPD